MIIFATFSANAQYSNLIVESKKNCYYESPLYRDQNNEKYSKLITAKFKSEIFKDADRTKKLDGINQVFNKSEIKVLFEEIRNKYGNFSIRFKHPDFKFGNNYRYNKRLLKEVLVPDLSQIVAIEFETLVKTEEIIKIIKSNSDVEYAEGPAITETLTNPDDPYCSIANQWYLFKDNFPKAWDITKGLSSIKIDINDQWGDYLQVNQVHTDLLGRFVQEFGMSGYYGDHGTIVSGVASALTNNQSGIAGAGWNVSLTKSSLYSASEITTVANAGVDVINMSWRGGSQALSDAIQVALTQGVICVAASGNGIPYPDNPVPEVIYPAAYNFGNIGQVIAVSGTMLNPFPSGTEDNIKWQESDGWHWYNFSPGTDPINDPTNSFIDVCAGGGNITSTATISSPLSHTYLINSVWGTSVAAPQVSALCGLILSINPQLTPPQVYDIITKSADKIGTNVYNSNGWNKYLGYGRINAYAALKYTIEHYGGTMTQAITIPNDEMWTIYSGVTVNFPTNCGLTVNGTLNIQPGANLKFGSGTGITCNGIINASGATSSRITFTSISPTQTWGGIVFNGSVSNHPVLSYCNVERVNGVAISINNSSGAPYITHCNITNNTTGVRIDNGAGYMAGNVIDNCSSALEVDNSGFVYFGLSSSGSFSCSGTKNNIIRNNLDGIYCGNQTISYLGNVEDAVLQGNCIYNNSGYNVDVDYGSSIYANNIYWGSSGAVNIVQEGGTFRCSTYCSTAPSSKYSEQTPEIAEGLSLKKNSNGTNSLTLIEDALNKQMSGDYEGAYKDYQDMIASSTKENNLDEVYLGLLSLFRESNLKEIPEYLENMNSKSGNPLLESCIANCYAVTDNTDLTLEKLDKIIANYPKTRYALSANVQKFYQYYFKKNDRTSAEKIYTELTGDYKDNRNVIYLASLLNKSNESNKSSDQNQDNKTADKKTTPEGFSLSNYPNPFNPSTVIRYSIPKDMHVKLIVYDVTGKEVKTLINETKAAGTYSAEFNAGKYASGVYYYKMEAGEYKNIQKMILVK